ncbi:hypothetical protein POM88_035915 [Heracleum sosnowskyi]|uniref:F-box domain-containing protein n=1 Tax=Heracleum sosnowskyi TaxID=360622 RepID=A0AAD8HP42_9APIA|nr:hypothetical protein POM88_035915 [Heracleum sosnowskyi]
MSNPAASKELKITIPDHINDDMLYEILLHLPINSLLRFKSVCKTWLAPITSPSFEKSQLATASSSNDQIHIAHTYDYEDQNDTSFVLLIVASREIVDYLEFPYMPDISIFGSACGFGFDPISNDFKVVTVVLPSYSAKVYSANRNAWRDFDTNLIDFPVDGLFYVCFNGFLCGAGSYGMIAFDLNREVFNCDIKFPAPTFDGSITEFDSSNHHATISKYNNFVAVIICKKSDYDHKINFWSLDDEACLRGGGISASWTLRLNIIVNQPVQFVHRYFRGGDFLLVDDDDVWYTKSLFKIDGFTQVNWNTQEDEIEDDNEDEIEDDTEDDTEDVYWV